MQARDPSSSEGGSVAVAVFDLDGTITRRDTLFPYIVGFLAQKPWQLLRLLRVLPAVLRFAARPHRGRLKDALIRLTLRGTTRQEIDAWNGRHLPRILDHQLHHDALAAITRHQAAGDYLVLMSASPDLYVPALGARLGFREVICTEVRWDGEVLDGSLVTINRRDQEKARCLAALRDRHPRAHFTAYGNTASDLPHLVLVERGVLVNGNRRTRLAAAARELEQVRWRGAA